jgi:phosphoglycerate dehydrogenase-like enzyme
MTILFLSDNPEGYQHISSNHLAQIKEVDPTTDIIISANPSEGERSRTEILIPVSKSSSISLSEYPSLQWIHMTSAGVNGLPEEIFTSEVILTNSSGVHPFPISEHIFSYLLMFARGIPTTYGNQRSKLWDRSSLKTFELHGKTIGIIGLGRIGQETARLAKAFQMKVIGVKVKKQQVDYVDELYTPDELDTVLKESDFIINCLPGTSETECFFTKERFNLMKPSAYFINIGRGTTVNESDLILSLEKGMIAGAGLDVFETEPLSLNSVLWKMPQVIITPHIAGMTPEYANRMINIFCENLQAFNEGKTLPNLVNKAKGY